MNYRWPAKTRKFDITDPLLRTVVVKYENEIPWQVAVSSQAELLEHVSSVMLPRVRERVAWPVVPGARHCYVSAQKLDVDRILEAAEDLDAEDLELVRLLREENRPEEAKNALAKVINASKAAAFKEWTDLFDKKYAKHPAFCLLVLRSLLDTTSARTWRSVIAPSGRVLRWLFNRMVSGSLSPDQKLSKVYADKLGAGLYGLPVNGWQYVSQSSDPDQLVAACRRSGWCIADRRWAIRYLRDNAFYLLRVKARPMVALRVSMESGKQIVVECQGPANTWPEERLMDVHLFLRSMKIELGYRQRKMGEVLNEIGDLRQKNDAWWDERERYWPFAGFGLREGEQENAVFRRNDVMTPYLHFPSIGTVISGQDMALSSAEWVKLVEVRPALYDDLPEPEASQHELFDACVRGWIGQMGERDMDLDAFLDIPFRVRSHEPFQVQATALYADVVKRNIMPSKKALNLFMPSRTVLEEYGAVAVARFQFTVRNQSFYLIDSHDEDRPDAVFESIDSTRDLFPVMRQEAWSMAIESSPELWFALPEDLSQLEEFRPHSGKVGRVDLDAWEAKLEERPWMLNQRNVLPYQIRFHERVLAAYMKGWLRNFAIKPWLDYVPRGMYSRRMTMRAAFCYHPDFVSGLERIFREGRNQMPDAWARSCKSDVRERSWYQVAILRALDPDKIAGGIRESEYQVAMEIGIELEIQDTPDNTRYSAEVRERLAALGVEVQSMAA